MKNFGVSLALGFVALLGLIIYTTPDGPERIVDGIIHAVAAVLIIAGTCGLIVSLGFAIGYGGRNLLQHRTPTIERERHIIERHTHTLDGRLPQAPQIMTLPGQFDQYPAQYQQIVGGARADTAHQLPSPAQSTTPQPVQIDLDTVYQPAEW